MYISFNTLNYQLSKAIENKELTPEELRSVAEKMRAEHKKTMKISSIVIGAVMLFLIIMAIIFGAKDGMKAEAVLSMAGGFVALIVVVFALVWVSQVGIVKFQFNSKVKKYYPELAGEVRV